MEALWSQFEGVMAKNVEEGNNGEVEEKEGSGSGSEEEPTVLEAGER